MISKFLSLFFAALEESCLQEGGDGDAMYLGADYKEMADNFEHWLTLPKNVSYDNRVTECNWIRQDSDTFITFTEGQQTIWFTNDSKVCPFVITIISLNTKFLINGYNHNQ